MTQDVNPVYCAHTLTENLSGGVVRCLNCHYEWLEPPEDADLPKNEKSEKTEHTHTGERDVGTE